ncbi:MAG TPA: phosphorylase, partial [Anaeromyxobacteraceae bacterium]|nr:phosphorylase [Anaeromyxobacteraceae bacterium]
APPPGWQVGVAGVGAVAAAARLAALLAPGGVERVLFVGTCGAYDGRLVVGDPLAAAEVIATSLDEARGAAYRPAPERARWSPGWALPLPGHTVAVTPAVTATEEGAAALARLAAAEHLELSGVFEACAQAGVPCAAALAVANRVGPEAHLEWKANHLEVSRALLEKLREVGVI